MHRPVIADLKEMGHILGKKIFQFIHVRIQGYTQQKGSGVEILLLGLGMIRQQAVAEAAHAEEEAISVEVGQEGV